jgi:hypothetical protein
LALDNAENVAAIQAGFAQKCLIVLNLSDADCGLPPHSAERLGLSGSDLSALS